MVNSRSNETLKLEIYKQGEGTFKNFYIYRQFYDFLRILLGCFCISPHTQKNRARQIWARNADKTPETEYKSLLFQIVYGGHHFMTLLLSTLRLSLAFNWSKKTSCHLIFRRSSSTMLMSCAFIERNALDSLSFRNSICGIFIGFSWVKTSDSISESIIYHSSRWAKLRRKKKSFFYLLIKGVCKH